MKSGIKKLGDVQRKTVRVAATDLVKTELLFADKPLPLLMQPARAGVDLFTWVENNHDFVQQQLYQYGGLLFRGFAVNDVNDFSRFIHLVSNEVLEYKERSSPRSAVSGNIYTSTDYPADQPIFLHNENSYQSSWPLKIFFFCSIPAQQGGATPIADCRRIYQRIPVEIRERFEKKGWMYVRNFGDGFGLHWKTVFQTDNRQEIEAYCRHANIEVEWKDEDHLRTRAVRQAVRIHPHTGERVWFNHATFYHVTTLPTNIRDEMLRLFAGEDLPTNTYYGDGMPIEDDTLDVLRQIYHEETVAFPWQKGDIMFLDNMLAAHGRTAYAGARKVLVGMADAYQPAS